MAAISGVETRFEIEAHGFDPCHTYPKGVQLLRQGVVPEEVFYLEQGIIKHQQIDVFGRETIVQLSFTGAWLGTAAAISGTPSPISAITCTPSGLACIRVRAFRERLETDAELSRRVHEVHARELCRQAGWIGQLTSLTSRQRLTSVIRYLVESVSLQALSSGTRVLIPLRQWELARLIAVTPEHLSRLLRSLQSEGILRREGGSLIIIDPERLHLVETGDAEPASRCGTVR